MTDLIERYVRHVGRHLPRRERAEIEAELRSQIQDQIDDRWGESATEAQIASVLAESGDPRQMAASYRVERYLVGPDLYPYMMMVLHRGWMVVPPVVIFLSLFGALAAAKGDLTSLLIEPITAGLQATAIFTSVVVLGFALAQQAGLKLDKPSPAFDPLTLPAVDDPGQVDRVESAFGVAMGTCFVLIMLYFLQAGGLTLRFNLSDPGEVLPVPLSWLAALIVSTSSLIVLHLVALRRNRWSAGLWLAETLLEVFGAICLYFVLYRPLFERILQSTPALATTPILGRAPEILAVGYSVITLTSRGIKLLRIWNYGTDR